MKGTISDKKALHQYFTKNIHGRGTPLDPPPPPVVKVLGTRSYWDRTQYTPDALSLCTDQEYIFVGYSKRQNSIEKVIYIHIISTDQKAVGISC